MINSKVDILTGGTWKEKHKDIILSFLEYLNERTNLYVLKGGTALMTCYGLDRFSEDIDLDSTDREAIYDIVSDFCQEYNYAFRVAKDTDSVKRFMIHYDDDTTSAHPLKIEISYRRREISPMQTLKINVIGIGPYAVQLVENSAASLFFYILTHGALVRALGNKRVLIVGVKFEPQHFLIGGLRVLQIQPFTEFETI